MAKRKPPTVKKGPASHYTGTGETIVEIHSSTLGKGCLLSIRDDTGHGLTLEAYRGDPGVFMRVNGLHVPAALPERRPLSSESQRIADALAACRALIYPDEDGGGEGADPLQTAIDCARRALCLDGDAAKLPVAVIAEQPRPRVIARFATIPEAEQFVADELPRAEVEAGAYGIDAPEELRNPR